MPYDAFQRAPADIRADRLVIGGRPIVEAWEAPVQRRLAELARRDDHVLEIGYGLGMASTRLAEIRPRDHYIIEAHPTVFEFARRQLSGSDHTAKLIEDFWEHAVGELPAHYFDVIIFDAYPYDSPTFDGSSSATMHFIRPILSTGPKLLKRGGVLGFIDFSCNVHLATGFLCNIRGHFSSFLKIEVEVRIPNNCVYATGSQVNVISLVNGS